MRYVFEKRKPMRPVRDTCLCGHVYATHSDRGYATGCQCPEYQSRAEAAYLAERNRLADKRR